MGLIAYKLPSLNFQHAQVAQLVEHRTENAGVGGSNPPLGTIILPKLLKHIALLKDMGNP